MHILLPDGDLRPSTRDRRRGELISILEVQSGTPSRRRLLVPLAAVAALGFALRDRNPRVEQVASAPAVEPLSAAEKVCG
jgi:hypothetical protein